MKEHPSRSIKSRRTGLTLLSHMPD